MRDRQISSGEITAETKIVDVAERWLPEFQDMVESGKKRPRALTLDEILEIFDKSDHDEIAIRHDLPDIMRYFGGTGTRTGETIAIRWN